MAIDEGPWIHRARRAGLRAALGRRILMLWRVACEDGCGRTVESKLIPLLVELNSIPHRWTCQSIDNLRRYLETCAQSHDADSSAPAAVSAFSLTAGDCVSPHTPCPVAPRHEIDAAFADWQEEAFHCIRAFLSARLSRERMIQSQASPPPEAILQPGLFDRRAERARLAAAAARAESDAVHQGRRRALELCANVSTKPPELLLVLTS